MKIRSRTIAVVAAAVLTLASCSASTVDGTGTRAASSGTASAQPSARRTDPPTADSSSCPSRYLPPDPHRPRVALAFTVADDHSTVSGTEKVTFRPDLPI